MRPIVSPFGNAGTLKYGINLDVNPNDFVQVKKAVQQHNIEMVVVGPEDPLVMGIHDFFLKDESLKSIPVIGPEKYAAQYAASVAAGNEDKV